MPMLVTSQTMADRPAIDRMTLPAIDPLGRLFPMEKMEAHRRGQKHLAVSVFIFDTAGRLLIQQRAHGKYHCGGMWANTCCTHPFWGESAAACASRRLLEEVGIELPLTERAVVEYRAAVTNGLIEHERVHVFEGVASTDVATDAFDPAEVASLSWVTRDELDAAVARAPETFTPWLRIYLNRWPELALKAAG